MKKLDLHMHSKFSDGDFSTFDLLALCQSEGLEIVSVTDHDTMDHLEESQKAGEEFGIKVITGTEISVSFSGQNFHLLGYGIDPKDLRLKEFLDKVKENRVWRLKEIAKKFQDLGFILDTEELLKKTDGTIGRPLIAKAVFNDKRNKQRLSDFPEITSYHILLDRFLTKGKEAFVDLDKIEFSKGIQMVHQAGGLAVWAHPLWNLAKKPEDFEPILAQLIAFGLDGVEVFYPLFSQEQTIRLFDASRKNKLLMTAGSDFHTFGHEVYNGIAVWQDYGLEWDLDPRLLK